MSLNNVIQEIKTILQTDTDLSLFCSNKYGKAITIKAHEFSYSEVPIKDLPVFIIAPSEEEKKERRFLFNEREEHLSLFLGILQSDKEKAQEEKIFLKEAVKRALAENRLLNGKVRYCTVTKSRTLNIASHPLSFMEIVIYINLK